MDQQTIDKLMELKKLYEAGILTQEEVEVEKKKILNPHQAQPVNEPAPEPEQPTEPEEEDVAIEEEAMPIMQDNEGRFVFEQPKVEQPSEPTNNPTSTDKQPNIWMWVAIGLGVVLFIFLLSKCNGSGNNDYENQPYPEVAIDSVSPEYVDEPAEIEVEPEITTTTDDEFAYDPWVGGMEIDGFVYRTCDVRCGLILEKESKGMYSGTISLVLGTQDDELNGFTNEYGWMDGKVRAKLDGNTLVVVLDSYTIKPGSEGNYIAGSVSKGAQIYRITYNGGTYTAKAIGKMEAFHDCDEITVKK